MLAAESDSIAPAQAGIERHIEPYSLTCADRPMPFIGGNVILGEWFETFTLWSRRSFNAGRRIAFDK